VYVRREVFADNYSQSKQRKFQQPQFPPMVRVIMKKFHFASSGAQHLTQTASTHGFPRHTSGGQADYEFRE
jgi:hypothetical protein